MTNFHHIYRKRVDLALGIGTLVEVFNKIYPIFLVHILIQRVGLDSFGQVQYGLTLIEIGVPLIAFGYDYFCLTTFKNKSMTPVQKKEVFSGVLIAKLLGFFAIGLVFSALFLLGYQFSPTWKINLIIVLASLGTVVDAAWIFLILRQTAIQNSLVLISKVTSFLLLYLAVDSEQDTVLYLSLSCLTNLSVNVSSFIYGVKIFGIKKPQLPTIVLILKKSVPFAVVTALMVLVQRVDVLAVKVLFGPKLLGLYAGPARINQSFLSLMSTVSMVFFSEQLSAKGKSENSRIFRESLIIISYLMAPLVMGVWLIEEDLSKLIFGQSLPEQRWLLSFMVLGNLGSIGMTLFGRHVLIVNKKNNVCSKVILCGMMFFAIIVNPLRLEYGLLGVAIAMTLSKVLIAGVLYLCARPYLYSAYSRNCILNLLMALVCLNVPVFLSRSSLILPLAIGCFAYLLWGGVLYRHLNLSKNKLMDRVS